MNARQSRSTVATIVLLVLAATSAGAHPGHGAPPSSAGVLHYLSEPVHVLPYDEALLEVEPTIGPILDRTASSLLDDALGDALEGLLGALLSTEETLTRCAS